MMVKYKVSDAAKDFSVSTKEIITILEKCTGDTKKAATTLSEHDLDVIFEVMTQNNQVKSFDEYFETGERARKAAAEQRQAEKDKKLAEQMALLHKAMELPEFVNEKDMVPYSLVNEFEKHNRELKKIKRYLKAKRQKSDFEYFLYQNCDRFLDKSEKILEEVKSQNEMLNEEKILRKGSLCHGDLQHHNTLLGKEGIFFINFEKFVLDSPMRDLGLFFRKMMEKNNWSKELGLYILDCYEKQRILSQEEKYQLYYRLSYPEKFWKIANFYFNSPKAWIPEKNTEKLEKVLKQEEEKFLFLESNFKEGVLHKG